MQATGHGLIHHNRAPANHGPTSASSCALFTRCDRLLFLTRALGWLLLLVALAPGCARLQLPAIDPNGSRIFLPFPNTTQLTVPRLHDAPGQPGTGVLPTPAFTTPVAPPACLDGGTAGGVCNLFHHKHAKLASLHDHFRSAGKRGEIQLTPMRVVAPVNGEVVLLAGICGENGYLVQREPLEWMLSPDSVGQFIEVGNDSPGKLAGLVHGPTAEKLDVDFARGRTSKKEQLITRGTSDCNDDIQLRDGETWLSISSPSEGVSRVTVLAPDSEIWDKRRQTATIYWVDADWQFPAPQVARSGETVQLVTRVTKSENFVPATGWTVRYTIADPSVAAFVGSSSPTLDVPVNANAQAIAQITSVPGARGTSPILIEVISEAKPTDNLPSLTIGSGQTAVTFSAAGLDLQLLGPEDGSPGEPLTYTATVGNPGDIDAENVALRLQYPIGTSVVRTSLSPSQQVDGGLIWEQGLLPAGRQFVVMVVLEAVAPGTVDVVFDAVGGGGGSAGQMSSRKAIRTEIVQSSVDARFAPENGIAQTEVGTRVQYEIDVTNTGRQTLTDLNLLIESSPGLTEAYQGQNTVSQTISMLQPGETRSLGISFDVQQEGQQTAKLTVRSGNAVLAERSASILGLPPRPKQPAVAIDLQMASGLRVGDTSQAIVVLRNSGDVKLSGIRVEILFDPELEISGVDRDSYNEFRVASDYRSAVWTPADLLPRLPGDGGDLIRRLPIFFRGKTPIAEAAIRVQVTTNEGVNAEDVATVQVIGATPTPTQPSPTIPSERTGSLAIDLSDLGDPTAVGTPFRYSLRITNGSNQPDRNVRVELKIPQGIEITEVTSDGTPITTNRLGQILQFPAIQFVRAGAVIDYIILVRPTVPQVMEMEARVTSEAQTSPIYDKETHTVTAR